MASGSLARRYARALIALGQEEGAVDAIAADLARLSDVLDLGDGVLQAAMNNPGLTATERKGIVDAVLARVGLHPLSRNYVRLLVDKNRFGAFGDIRREFDRMADELSGRVRAHVTTASELSPPMAARVEKALAEATGAQVLVTWDVDPGLIGGIVAQVGDKIYDASVRARLRELQEALLSDTAPAQA